MAIKKYKHIQGQNYFKHLHVWGVKVIIGMESIELPAVHHHRPSVRRCRGLDPAQESQQAGGVVWHTVLRPGGEMELAHLMFSRVTSLEETAGHI